MEQRTAGGFTLFFKLIGVVGLVDIAVHVDGGLTRSTAESFVFSY
jgi:hypothetical protein